MFLYRFKNLKNDMKGEELNFQISLIGIKSVEGYGSYNIPNNIMFLYGNS